jgi:hypothetical protein
MKNSIIDCVNPVRFKQRYIANDASMKEMRLIKLVDSFLNEFVAK